MNKELINVVSTTVAEVTIEGKALSIASIKEIFAPLINGIENFKQDRFYNRMMLFSDPANSYVSAEDRKAFFSSLSGEDKEMISSFIEKIYNADYELHVHLYKFLNDRLIKNGTLDYYDHTLFTNMEQFTSLDLEVFWYQVDQNKMQLLLFSDNEYIEFDINKRVKTDVLSIGKFISLGLLQQSDIKIKGMNFGGTSMSLVPTGFIMNEYMKNIYEILDKVINEKIKEKLIEKRKSQNTLDEWV